MSIVTITVLQYEPFARFGAFANMGRVLSRPFRAEGLEFSKLMGSGFNFGVIPNLSTYVFLGVWSDVRVAQAFPQTDIYHSLSRGTQQTSTLYLQPQRAHGLWDGQNPFSANSDHLASNSPGRSAGAEPGASQRSLPTSDSLFAAHCSLPTDNPVAVLTRATIRPRALLDFWRHVPQARQRLTDYADDLLFGIGVGEVPLVQQCTISVWRDAAAVNRYAYRQSGHKEVVRLTRERKWYSEELFARFSVLRAEGDLFEPVNRLLS